MRLNVSAWQTSAERPIFHVILICVLCAGVIVPFAGRAFNIDEPLFIWTAKQIRHAPLDPYGFKVNWYGYDMPMSQVTKNPPLAAYYIALASFVTGWHELGLRVAFLLPFIAAALGTYCLARLLCSRPLLATLATVVTPAFMLAGVTVMCDTLMLAFWVWSIALWIKGSKENRHWLMAIASLLAGASALTKYFGIALIPLLLAWSFCKARKPSWQLLWLLVPVAMLVVYQLATRSLYGRGLLTDAGNYATKWRLQKGTLPLSKAITGLSFTGGCILTVLFYSHALWRRRTLLAGVALFVAGLLLVVLGSSTGTFPMFKTQGTSRWLPGAELAIFAVCGFAILTLAVMDVRQNRTAESWLLCLWVFGTFIFASFINWTVNGRSVLPLAPVAGISLARRLEFRDLPDAKKRLAVYWPLLPVAGAALVAVFSDASWANSQRTAASHLIAQYQAGHRIWFQGHWGFQYYMQEAGAQPFDIHNNWIQRNDIVISPSKNTNVHALPSRLFETIGTFVIRPCPWMSVADEQVGAGYYSDVYGPLPFGFGKVAADEYEVMAPRTVSKR